MQMICMASALEIFSFNVLIQPFYKSIKHGMQHTEIWNHIQIIKLNLKYYIKYTILLANCIV